MKVDLQKMDWKQDKNLLAIERKLAGLSNLEIQARGRLAELQEIVRTAEASLVQARVARMLDETSDEQETAIHERLSASRREMVDLQADIEATTLARKRLEPALEAATKEARLRVAQMLVEPYRENAESLQALLKKAVELNQQLHAIHAHIVQHGINGEIVGRDVLKPLAAPLAWNELSQVGGQLGGKLAYWDQYVDGILAGK